MNVRTCILIPLILLSISHVCLAENPYIELQKKATEDLLKEINRQTVEKGKEFFSKPQSAKEGACLDDIYGVDLSKISSFGLAANDAIYKALIDQLQNMACDKANEYLQTQLTEMEDKIKNETGYNLTGLFDDYISDLNELSEGSGFTESERNDVIGSAFLGEAPVLAPVPDAQHVDTQIPNTPPPSSKRVKAMELDKLLDLQGLFKPKKEGDDNGS